LESLGVRFIRFTESEVKYDMVNGIRALTAKIFEIVELDPTVKLPGGFDLAWLNK
jgi:hypothetical protein